MKLREIAHSRTGDKGDISNISLIAFKSEDYEMIKEKVTERVVKEWLKGIVQGNVVLYEQPNLNGFNFVMYGVLGVGVTSTLAQDIHGKSLSSNLLDVDI